MDTAEFSKFADILSVALSQHDLPDLKMMEFIWNSNSTGIPSPPLTLFVVMLPTIGDTSTTSDMWMISL